MSNTEAVIYFKKLNGKYSLVNKKFLDMFSLELDDIVGKTHYGALTEEISIPHRKNDLQIIASKKLITFEETAIQPDGLHYYVSVKFPVFDENNNLVGTGGISTDITERKQLENKLHAANQALKTQVSRDYLTGLLNRRSFHEVANAEIARFDRFGASLSLIILDIDFFKKINDSFGHEVGDNVLLAITKVISSEIRKTDYFFRFGGDEFVILLPETGLDEAVLLAGKVRIKISEHWITPVGNVNISLGIAEMLNSDDLDSFLKSADKALYQSKRHGRNKVTVSSSAE